MPLQSRSSQRASTPARKPSPQRKHRPSTPVADPKAKSSRARAKNPTLKPKQPRWNFRAVVTTRSRAIFILLLMFLGYTVYNLALLSFNEENAREAQQLWTYEGPLLAARGDILDRNGAQLATSLACDTIVAAPPQFLDEDIDLIAARLAPLLDMEEEEIRERLTSPKQQINLKRLVEPEVTAQVTALIYELDISGINVFKEPKRYYPWNAFASTVLGIAGIDNNGLEGLEYTYDVPLSGEHGSLTQQKSVAGLAIPDTPFDREPARDGNHLVLTLDSKAQSILEKLLSKAYIENKAEAASGIIMDPWTGEILAMASFPNFDPNNYDAYPTKARSNKLIQEAFEPGSTFKLITALAALEEGLVYEEELFEDPGYITIGGTIFRNWDSGATDHGWESFKDAMRKSCNVVLTQIGERLGAERLVDYHHLMGFGTPTGIDYPDEAAGILFEPEYMGPTELATASFGQGPAVTPIQQVTAIAAIANGGKLMRPHFALELRNQSGQTVEAVQPNVIREVASSQTMQRMRDLMEYILNDPDSKGASTKYRLAGKTGTANKFNPESGTYYEDKYIASTIGFAPADKPLYVIYVYVDDPKGPNGFYGGQVAAPLFKAIAEELLFQDSRVAPLELNEDEYLTDDLYACELPRLIEQSKEDATAILTELHLKVQYKGEGSIVVAQYPFPDEANSEINSGQTVTLYLSDPQLLAEKKIIVPDFTAKTMKEVLSIVDQLDINPYIEGKSGTVYDQKPKAGEILEKGAIIKVSFR